MSKQRAVFVKWMGPILDCLRELGGSARPRQVCDWIANKYSIPDEQREATLKSGAERFPNQVAWARQYLVWEGLLDGSKRGEWTLTKAGAKTRLQEEDGRSLFKKWVEIHALARRSASQESKPRTAGKVKSEIPPDEVAEAVERSESERPPDEIEEHELLSVIQGLPPEGFERLCKRLLFEWGFADIEVTGKSHDGGVDGVGVLQLNPFVSFQIAFQCKRYRGSVSRAEVASFRGSAKADRADKLILITTGHFTREAIQEANGGGALPVRLVDGEELVSLFQRKNLGVRRREVFDVDLAFFDLFRSAPAPIARKRNRGVQKSPPPI
jgi:restriction system protein